MEKLTLFEITNHLMEIQEYLNFLCEAEDDNINEEDLERIFNAINEELNCSEEAFDEKICNYGKLIKNLNFKMKTIEAQRKIWKKEIDDLKMKEERLDKYINRLKDSMMNAMRLTGREKIKDSVISISLRNSKSVEVIDPEKAVKLGYGSIEYKPSKALIKDAIKNNINVDDFAYLKSNTSVHIR